MFAALLSASLMTPAAPVPKDFRTNCPASYAVQLTPDPDGVVRVLAWRQAGAVAVIDSVPGVHHERLTEPDVALFVDSRVALTDLTDLRITTADGKVLTVREATRRIEAGTPAVASADGRPVNAVHRGALKPGTLVMVSPDLANRVVQKPVLRAAVGELVGVVLVGGQAAVLLLHRRPPVRLLGERLQPLPQRVLDLLRHLPDHLPKRVRQLVQPELAGQ